MMRTKYYNLLETTELIEIIGESILFGSTLYFWGATILFLVLVSLLEIKEKTISSALSLIIYLSILEVYSNVSIISLKSMFIYTGLGLIYSLIRTYFYGRKFISYNGYLLSPSSEETQDNIDSQKEERRKKLKDNALRWWALFPVSLLNWILSDLIKESCNLIYKIVKHIFVAVMELGNKNK